MNFLKDWLAATGVMLLMAMFVSATVGAFYLVKLLMDSGHYVAGSALGLLLLSLLLTLATRNSEYKR